MTKSAQQNINNNVLSAWADICAAYKTINIHTPAQRLRAAQAYVYDTGKYYVLRSYDTVVAAIDKTTNICYDALRHVYGYTATSAQHIAKFCDDYGATAKFVYRDI